MTSFAASPVEDSSRLLELLSPPEGLSGECTDTDGHIRLISGGVGTSPLL